MTERLVKVNEVELCVDAVGDPADPAVLLIPGAASAMDWWDPEFCARIAAGGRYVIRYDPRDTGRSTSWPAGEPGYTGEHLVADVVGLLDALGIDRVHLVGLSMGGGTAQHVAVHHGDRVATLTLISTTPDGPGAAGIEDLPPMSDELQARFAEESPRPDFTDREAAIDWLVDDLRAFAGSHPFDEPYQRRVVGESYDRATDFEASVTNHWLLEGGEPIRDRLGRLEMPTLVMHGTEDPLFPLGHGEALVREIPGAKLIVLDRVGHEVPPPPTWDVVVPAIVEHTAAR